MYKFIIFFYWYPFTSERTYRINREMGFHNTHKTIISIIRKNRCIQKNTKIPFFNKILTHKTFTKISNQSRPRLPHRTRCKFDCAICRLHVRTIYINSDILVSQVAEGNSSEVWNSSEAFTLRAGKGREGPLHLLRSDDSTRAFCPAWVRALEAFRRGFEPVEPPAELMKWSWDVCVFGWLVSGFLLGEKGTRCNSWENIPSFFFQIGLDVDAIMEVELFYYNYVIIFFMNVCEFIIIKF